MANNERRRVFIAFDPWMLADMLHKDACYRIQSSSIPKDAKYLGSHYDIGRDRFLVAFEHSSFDVVEPGHCLPIISDITIEQVNSRYFKKAQKRADEAFMGTTVKA